MARIRLPFVALGALAALSVVVPAAAESRAPWMIRVADFFHATPPPAVPATQTTAVAAFPDVAPERPKAAPDPALELLNESPYGAELAAAQAREQMFGPNLDREDPYAEQMKFANPYTEDLHLVNPYATAGRYPRAYTARATPEPDLSNPYAAARAPRRAPQPDLTNPYSGR